MNTDWIAYGITAAAVVALGVRFFRKKKGGCCGKDSCAALKPKEPPRPSSATTEKDGSASQR